MSHRSRFRTNLLVLLGMLTMVISTQPAFAQEREPEVDPIDPTANTRKYPKVAKRILGVSRLKRLPKRITAYLADPDWVAIHRMCKTMDPDAILHCMVKNPKPIGAMVVRRITTSMVNRIDVELVKALNPAQIDTLGNSCRTEADVWAKCASEKGFDSDECSVTELPFVRCLVGSNFVPRTYMATAAKKRALFGDDLFVEFTGLLAGLSFDKITQLRKSCPQRDFAGADKCFQNNPVAGTPMRHYLETATPMVRQAAAALKRNNVTMDVAAYTARVTAVLLRIPKYAIAGLVTLCQRRQPEFKQPKTLADVDAGIACVRDRALVDPIANPVYATPAQLKAWLFATRARITAALTKAHEQQRARGLGKFWVAVFLLAGLGFIVVLLLPLLLAKRYPDRGGAFWRSSALAAVVFVVAVAALAGALTAMRSAQGLVAEQTSPKVKSTHAAFKALQSRSALGGFSALSQAGVDFFKHPLVSLAEPVVNDEHKDLAAVLPAYFAAHWIDQLSKPQVRRLRQDAPSQSSIQGHTAAFASSMRFYKRVDWLLGVLPVILALLAVLLYLAPMRRTLVDIAVGPANASGETSRSTKDVILAEAKSAVPFIGCVIVLIPLVGALLSVAVSPLTKTLFANAILSVFYVATSNASSFTVFAATMSVIVLLLLCVATYVAAVTGVLGTVRRIFYSVEHHGRGLGEFASFWKWGGLSLLLLLLFPLVFAFGVEFAYHQHVGSPTLPVQGAALTTVPVVAVLLFPLVFWAARGFKALGFLHRYSVPESTD